MPHTVKEKDGSTRTTTQAPDPFNSLTLTMGSKGEGFRIYTKESAVDANNITWRWHHDEPPAK